MTSSNPFARRPFRVALDPPRLAVPIAAVTTPAGSPRRARVAWPLKSWVSLLLVIVGVAAAWLLLRSLQQTPRIELDGVAPARPDLSRATAHCALSEVVRV